MLSAEDLPVSDAKTETPPAPRDRPSTTPEPPFSPPARRVAWWQHLGRAFTAGDPILTLLVVALVVYYRATRGIFQGKASGDGFFGFMMLPGVILHHTFDLGVPAPEWAAVIGREKTGLVPNGCPIGPALLWTPTYLLGLAFDKLAAVPGLGSLLRLIVPSLHARPFSGREESDFFMAGLGSLAAGLLGMRLTFTLVARRLGVAAARFGVVGAIAATPLAFYFVTQPLYQHACAFFGVALLLERWDAWRGQMTLQRWAALGALGGVAMLMRQQEGLYFFLPAVDALVELGQALRARDLRRAGRTILGGVLFLGCALLVYSPQLLLWRHYYGSFRPPQEPGHFIWWNPAILEALFSMRAGLFPWVPALYLAVPGLLLARRRLDGLVWRLGVVFALELWLNASVWDYHGSWAYGPRRYTDSVGIVALGLGGLYVTLGSGFLSRGRLWALRAVVVALALLVVWNTVLMELVRTRRVKSSAAGAYPLAMWAHWAGAPPRVVRALDHVAYPFVQPLGWIYALVYRMPVIQFEGLLGSYILERDWKIRAAFLSRGFGFAEPQWYVVDGVNRPSAGTPAAPSATGLVPVGPRVRALIPLMAREPLHLYLSGALHGQAPRVTWNGTVVTAHLRPTSSPNPAASELDVVEIDVPETIVHSRARLNELVIDNLAPGAALKRLDFNSVKEWWHG